MAIRKRSLQVHQTEDGYQVTARYGSVVVGRWELDPCQSVEDFLFHTLALEPGDRLEVDITSEDQPTARVGRPRPARRKNPQPTD